MIAASIAFALVVVLVPIVRRLCIRWRLFDMPGPLKIHSQPIPRLGGVAIVLAIATAAGTSSPHRAAHSWPFFGALILIWATGLADDLRGVPPYLRLTAQFLAGALLWRGGWRVPIPGNGALEFAATILFVAGFTNAMNLLDGMDGLAAGVVGIIAGTYLGLPSALTNPFALTVACSLVGACAGFLRINFPPANLYLGDNGSTILGFGIAFLGLDLYRSRSTSGPVLLFPLLIAGLPLLDAVFAVIRRLRHHRSPLHGDRAHIYDLLHTRGWPPRRIALAFYGATAALAAIGLIGVRTESRQFWGVAAVSVGLIVFAALRLGVLRGNERDMTVLHKRDQVTERRFSETSQSS
jgi:UDP-GlcNAc:undecaprenyl-phosphate/decaprenyl-phosphate GlcNAc-1-phosphate transferase